jgi:hypothetical protein
MSSLLSDLGRILNTLCIPWETGVFTAEAPETYCVLVPLVDEFPIAGDDTPLLEQQHVRISLYAKGNYVPVAAAIRDALILRGVVITHREYVEFEPDTRYHSYVIDTTNIYSIGGNFHEQEV